MLKVSMIVPVLNDAQALNALLEQVLQADAPWLEQMELLICDGGSTDLTAAMVRRYQQQLPQINLVWVACPAGRAVQMAQGAKQAQGDVLFFVHADSILPPQWFSALQHAEWGRFNVSLSGDKIIFRIIEWLMNKRSCLTQVATGDQGIFVKKSLYQAVGGWDLLPLMEDIALSKKLRKRAKMACVQQPIITSSRRWESNGVMKTIVLMWWLRALFVLGVSPDTLHRWYYPNHRVKDKRVLQVFSKLPIPGTVKTRLIPELGEQQATRLHHYLLDQCLQRCAAFTAPLQLWLAPYKANEQSLTAYKNDQLFMQQGTDLGQKMSHALQQGLQQFERVVLIGTDQLDIDAALLTACMEALNSYEVAIVPAKDGGFVAIACRVFDAAFFADIAWSTAQVLEQLQHNLAALNVRYYLFKPVRDIDTMKDVRHYPELLSLIQNSA